MSSGMTNFAAIKKMSVEQMVEFFANIDDYCDICSRKNIPGCCNLTFEECKLHIREYLMQEAPEPREPMTVNEYQKLAMRTDNPRATWADNMFDGLLGLNGEAGECADIMKKHFFQGHEFEEKDMIEELGDVAWYLAKCATALGIDLEDIFRANIQKLEGRYPDGFDSERSVNREK